MLDRSIQERYTYELARLVEIPTVSADPGAGAAMGRMAEHTSGLLEERGFAVEVFETPGNPIIFGEHIGDESWPTILIYNHLDVQPGDGDWEHEPFKLHIEGDKMYGRGATDDKGPALAALFAVEQAIADGVPLNFKIIWETEEEIGSPNFAAAIARHAERLAADSVLVSDTEWISEDVPAITTGLRGLLTFELSLKTADKDTHSGSTGGFARNPVAEIAGIIATCIEPKTGEVLISGFYDGIIAPSDEEVQSMLASGFSVNEFREHHGLRLTRTNDLEIAMRKIMAEPTLEVHGITGGYAGNGIKTIIPHEAGAKLSCRLVPGQNTETLFEIVKKHVRGINPDVEITKGAGADPFLADVTGPHVKAMATAYRKTLGKDPSFVREGGSIGAVLALSQTLNAPIVMAGLSLPSDGYHAINEHFRWSQAQRGIEIFNTYFRLIAGKPKS